MTLISFILLSSQLRMIWNGVVGFYVSRLRLGCRWCIPFYILAFFRLFYPSIFCILFDCETHFQIFRIFRTGHLRQKQPAACIRYRAAPIWSHRYKKRIVPQQCPQYLSGQQRFYLVLYGWRHEPIWRIWLSKIIEG